MLFIIPPYFSEGNMSEVNLGRQARSVVGSIRCLYVSMYVSMYVQAFRLVAGKRLGAAGRPWYRPVARFGGTTCVPVRRWSAPRGMRHVPARGPLQKSIERGCRSNCRRQRCDSHQTDGHRGELDPFDGDGSGGWLVRAPEASTFYGLGSSESGIL